MDRHVILGVHLTDRVRQASEVQQVFTEFGGHIKTRLGLHDVGPGGSATTGLIVLELIGDTASFDAMAARLKALEGVEVQRMVFGH